MKLTSGPASKARGTIIWAQIVAVASLGLSLSGLALAKDKKKAVLPDYVLQAHTIAVVVDPDAPVSAVHPNDNKDAADRVERALMTWGRYQPMIDPRSADLVILIRKGRAPGSPVIGGVSNGNDRPLIIQQPTDNETRVGGQWGTPHPLSQPPMQPQQPTGPMPGPARNLALSRTRLKSIAGEQSTRWMELRCGTT